ncbi:MAG: transposase [cyanobacterium endosymbiont of Epithemia adnata isolate EadnSB Bon19]
MIGKFLLSRHSLIETVNDQLKNLSHIVYPRLSRSIVIK